MRARKAIEERKYLKAAAGLCTEMYEKGCVNVLVIIDKKQVVVDTVETIDYLIGKAEEIRENDDR